MQENYFLLDRKIKLSLKKRCASIVYDFTFYTKIVLTQTFKTWFAFKFLIFWKGLALWEIGLVSKIWMCDLIHARRWPNILGNYVSKQNIMNHILYLCWLKYVLYRYRKVWIRNNKLNLFCYHKSTSSYFYHNLSHTKWHI